jgi:hypothetical protein
MQSPRRGVDDRDVVVDQQVVQAGRRDVVRERLQRQPVVARREPQLGGRDLLRRRDAGQFRWRV